MIIECAHCHARYQYDEARFEGKPAKKIRCAKCHQVFEIHNPATAAKGETTAKPQSSAPTAARRGEDAMDMTMPGKALKTVEEPLPAAVRTAPVEARQEAPPKLPEGRRLSLAIIEGPDAGKVYRIDKPKVVIGRSGADLVLNDAETSRAHAAVEIRDSVMLLQDLGSRNGTLVEGSKIEGQVELQNQSEFQIGSTTLMLIVTEEA